jgi:hypothetical protein
MKASTLAGTLLLLTSTLCGAELRVGVGRTDITPEEKPIWLAGYAARTTPATGMLHRVWAKALVFEESPSNRVALITVDLLGLSREITETVSARLAARHGLARPHLIFNASHTHSGPPVWPCLSVCFDFSPHEQQRAEAYGQRLGDALVETVDQAVKNLAPARVACGRGSAEFAANRRAFPDKPVDHDVPVLRVSAPDGTVRAVLFGYACHNTTLVGNNLLLNGDYAGFAQLDVERLHPGATALFLQGCAGDQNPSPRGTVELARQYGKSLAEAVEQVLSGEMRPVRAPIRTELIETRLEFPPFNAEHYRQELQGTDIFKKRRAKLMLERYDSGAPIRSIPYPVQALRFNDDLTLLALSGEIVVDYSLRAKREYAGENLFVAGYCSEVCCYIPSRRVLKEGGYEADQSMIYYGLPGPFADRVEETVFDAVHDVLRCVGVKPATGVADSELKK